MHDADRVLEFWLDELEPKDWYVANDAVDARIREEFEPLWHRARRGELGLWLTDARGALAYVIVTDQMSRNMFRGDPRSFELDGLARAAAKLAITKRWDREIPTPQRQFIYMPLMHSENLVDQDRCVRLFCERMPDQTDNLLHARAHREVIREFGRFPFRNDALGRQTTEAEKGWLEQGGYGAVVERLKSAS